MASSSSSTTSQVGQKYDVFVSFRGEDTRNNFFSFLRGKLHEGGVQVFNDERLNRGQEISESLLNGIEESIIYVVIFSKGYASSRWCLDELVKIIECKETYSKIVLPVFFLVDPSHVRNQTGPFGDGFNKLLESLNKEKFERLQLTEEEFEVKVQAWRDAMTKAANLPGYTVTSEAPQHPFVIKIKSDIIWILNRMSSADIDYLVGIQPIINYMVGILLGNNFMDRSLIRLGEESRNVRCFGIWGMGGTGKTTIAEAVFYEILSYSVHPMHSYFARNIRERSIDPDMLARLQQDLFSKILEDQDSRINSIFTKRRLGRKRVLIVFDDVTHLSQIESLIGDIRFLGKGSLVIITSRDKQVLKTCGVDERDIYKLGGLSPCDARKLFYKYAFRQDHPKDDYCELSNSVVKYAQGVPLALKVLGSSLFDKPKGVWECVIDKLEIIPHVDIYKVLKVSYDGLCSTEQNIFLDVACFLKWENMDFVKRFLDACEFYVEEGIRDLVDKCLITISDDNKITMHDLLQKMGWEIVREESMDYPGKRTRLWYYKDICNVLEQNKGTEAIQGMCLDMSKLESNIHLQRSALAKMHYLRFFRLYNSFTELHNINKVLASLGLDSISNELRYLCWHGCPLKSWMPSFHPGNLIELDMPHSNIEQLGSNVELQFNKLKHINLSYSKHLKSLELSVFPNLESLILKGCTNLRKISSSIHGRNYKLVVLNLMHCKSLQSLPIGIHSKSLREVILSRSSNLIKMFAAMILFNIDELLLDETEIEEQSVVMEMKSVEYLNLSGCTKLDGFLDNFKNLEALKELNVTNCCIKKLPNNLGQLSSLESLLLGGNNFESIPTSIIKLCKLTYLDISYCDRLQTLPKLPSQLERIDAHNCISLEGPPYGYTSKIANVNFINCFKLVEPQISRKMEEYFLRLFGFTEEVARRIIEIGPGGWPETRRVQRLPRIACICFPGNEIPEWFNDQRPGPSTTLRWYRPKLIWCAIVEFRNYKNEGQKLALGFDCTFSGQDEDRQLQGCDGGRWRIWGTGTAGPDFVRSEHVFMGHYFYSSINFNEVTITFFVEDLNGEGVDFCRVKKFGLFFPHEF